ncbi:hypothetical protein MIND_00426900 [Mycena indigotica]|uniref:PEBP-like protein n=1 Tax=Mycena indigotica TaxID=2126181 RepID=A0A8H6SXW8_9AGAR|nr:uncharacterized protein MIND_00426900 [Mycena indigotica]KAF7306357.1 hypothetical protein MIND_00426900 [Mycena indigotica]
MRMRMLRLALRVVRPGPARVGVRRATTTAVPTPGAAAGAPPPPPTTTTTTTKSKTALTPRPAHVPAPPKHGRRTRKASSRPSLAWTPPAPRAQPTPHALARAARRRARLARAFAAPQSARVPRFRVGFHVVRHAMPLRRGRRGRLGREARKRLEARGLLESRRNRKRTGRARVGMDAPRRWNAPVRAGVLPAYDEAVRLIRADAGAVRREAQALRAELRVAEKGGARAAEVEGMRERLHVLDVQSEVNLPEVRWSVANGMADMRIPSHRHLVEQRWRKEGDLDLLMERLHQMHVLPDVLPALHPTVDLRLTARLMPAHFAALMRRNRAGRGVNTYKEVVPGNYLTPKQTMAPPRVYANAFHTDVRLYTLLMLDADVPDPQHRTYTTFLHWLKPNIPLSATHAGRLAHLNSHTAYIPPHPQRGTPYHRYVTLLLPQPPRPGARYDRASEAAMAAQQAALEQRGAAAKERARQVEAAVAEAASALGPAGGGGRGRTTRPTHPNAAPEAEREHATLSARLEIPVVRDAERLRFDVRAFVKRWGLGDGVRGFGGGAHMFRGVWDSQVGAVYRYKLHEPQPRYGRANVKEEEGMKA